jgi:fibronectin-binding autotransporter adhesin
VTSGKVKNDLEDRSEALFFDESPLRSSNIPSTLSPESIENALINSRSVTQLFMKSTARLRLFLLCSGLLASPSLNAASRTWDANAGTAGQTDGLGVWLASNQWWTGTANTTWASLDDAIFGNGGVGGAVTLASPTTANSLTFNSFTGTYTLGTTGVALTINSGITKNSSSAAVTFVGPITLGGAQTWTNNSTGLLTTANGTNMITNGGFQLTVDGTGNTLFGVPNNAATTLSGSGALVKNGTGVLTMGGNNSAIFSGNVTVGGGVLNYGDFFTSLGTGNITISGGALEARWTTGFTLAQGAAAGQIQITGGISGLGGAGSAATFNIGAVTWGSGTFAPSEFILQTSNANATGQSIFSSAIDLNGANRTIRSDQTGNNTTGSGTFSGAITNSTGTAGLTKNGIGYHVLTGTNTYNGGTTINAGILKFANTVSMPSTGNVTVNTGATLAVDVTGAGKFTNATSGAGSFGGILAGVGVGTSTVTYSGDVTLGIDITGGATTYSGVIANPVGSTSLSLRKINGQNLTLTGANTYSGKTIIGGGSIFVASFGNIGDASSPLGTNSTIEFLTTGNLSFTGTTVESCNKTFDIAQTDATFRADGTGVGAITLTANINPTSTVNKTLNLFGASTNANTISGVITNGAGGALNVVKNLAGTWVLSGANTYTNGTTLSAGKLVAVGSSALGTGTITWGATGTTLQFQNDANLTVTNTLATSVRDTTRTLVVDRATAGAAVNLQFNSAPNFDCGTVFNFQKGANITSGTPTITFNAGTGSSDSNNGSLTGGVAVGPITFTPTGVDLVINGISSSGRTRGYIFQGDSTGNRITGTFANGNGTSIRKAGTGTWTLAGTINYTGATEINAGTLALGANNVLPNGTAVSLGAGILDAATFDDTTGTLDVSSTATINLGVGANLAFADSDMIDWTSGTLNVTGTLDPTSLRFGTDNTGLTPAQLALISVNGSGAGTYVLDASGYLIAGGGNTPPTITDIANQSVPSGGNTGALAFTVGDAQTPVGSLTVSGASSNTTLVPNANIVFGGSGASRDVTVTPVSGLVGSAIITVTVTDGGSLTAQDTFTLIVTDNYLSWATLNGVTGGVSGDHDNDGVKNLVEYALVDGGERGVLSGNTITFSKRLAPYGTDLTYDIESSTGLISWSVLAKPPVVETASAISYTFTPSSPVKNFARLKVVQVP